MAYIVNQPIRIEYQPPGGEAGLAVSVEILDETGFTDLVNYPLITLTDMPLTGSSIYTGAFTPDVIGTWTIHVYHTGGSIVKQYIIVESIESKLTIPAMVG